MSQDSSVPDDVRECPFCGEARREVLSYRSSSYGMCVYCGTCGATGPATVNPATCAEALRLWNRRVVPLQTPTLPDDARAKALGEWNAACERLKRIAERWEAQSLGVASNEQERDGGQSAEGKGERSATVAGATGRGQSDSTADKAASDSGVSDAPSSLPSDPAVEAYYAAREALRVTHQDEPPLPFRKVIIAADVLAARVEALRAENARLKRQVATLHGVCSDQARRVAAAEARALKAERDLERIKDANQSNIARWLDVCEKLTKAERDTEEARSRAAMERDARYFDSQKNVMTAGMMSLDMYRERHALPWEATLSEGEQKV
jgi:Lar family restriction alleviation protein